MESLGKIYRNSKTLNLAALVLSFALGQGSLLISQSTLIGSGEYELSAVLGISLLVASITVMIIDWGGQVMIATSFLKFGQARALTDLAALWSIRAIIMLVCIAAISIGWSLGKFDANSFSLGFYTTSMLSFLALVVNPSGLLDGLQKSGVNGAITALPLALVAAGILFLEVKITFFSGMLMGGLYAAGTFIGSFIQYVALGKSHISLFHILQRLWILRLAETAGVFRNGIAILLIALPGQIFFRCQVAVMTTMGPYATSTFILAKQFIGGLSQLSLFAIRTELHRFLESEEQFRLESITKFKSFRLALGTLVTLLLICFGVRLFVMGSDNRYAGTVDMVALLSPTIVLISIIAILSQWILVHINSRPAASINILCTLIGIGLLAIPLTATSKWTVLAIEIVIQILQCLLLLRLMLITFPSPRRI